MLKDLTDFVMQGILIMAGVAASIYFMVGVFYVLRFTSEGLESAWRKMKGGKK
jgi:hypothetical protein